MNAQKAKAKETAHVTSTSHFVAAEFSEVALARKAEVDRLAAAYGGDLECASTTLAKALKEVSAQRELQAEQVRLLEEDLATARLFYSEAVTAERELIRLLNGDLFTGEHQNPDAVEAEEVKAWVQDLHAKEAERKVAEREVMAMWNGIVPDMPPPDTSPPYVHTGIVSDAPAPVMASPPKPMPRQRGKGKFKPPARRALAEYKAARGLH